MTTHAIRVKLREDHPLAPGDPLGRTHAGYTPDTTYNDLWDRARGIWKLNPKRAQDMDLLIGTHNGQIVVVGQIEQIVFYKDADRHAIIGTPLPHHPLLGQPDPRPDTSRNPVGYIQTDA